MVEVRELVKTMAQEGMTIFVSSHLLFEVEQVCSHVTIINRGTSLVSDTLQNVSSMLSGPTTLQVEVAKLSDTIVEAVKKLSFVANVSHSGNTLSIELKTRDDVRPQVSQEITKSGGVIVSMSLKGQTLEDVFIQLISKRPGGNA
jgi:ABC-2 type transport system ATP-binding protein